MSEHIEFAEGSSMPTSTHTPAPTEGNDPRRAVLLEMFRAIRLNQICHLRAAAYYEQCNRSLGIPVVILSTIVGTSIFSTLEHETAPWIKVTVGLLSILAAVLSSLQLFLKPHDQLSRHQTTAVKYGALRRELEGLLGDTLISAEEWNIFRKQFCKKWNNIDREAPTCSQRIHDAALRHMERRTPYSIR